MGPRGARCSPPRTAQRVKGGPGSHGTTAAAPPAATSGLPHPGHLLSHTRFQRLLAAVSTHLVPHLLDLFWVSVQRNKQVRDSRGGSSVSLLFSPLKYQAHREVRVMTTVSDTAASNLSDSSHVWSCTDPTENEPMAAPSVTEVAGNQSRREPESRPAGKARQKAQLNPGRTSGR